MIKAARVRIFVDGIRLAYCADTILKFSPDIEEADNLMKWFTSRRNRKVTFLVD